MMKTKSILFLILLLISLPCFAQQTKTPEKVSALEIVEEGEPATLFYQNREIVTLRARIGKLKPEERVALAQRRLAALPDFALREKVRIEKIAEGLLVSVGPYFITAIAPQDLDPSTGRTLEQEGQVVVRNLNAAIQARWAQRDVRVLMRAIAFSVLATLVFLFVLLYLFRLRAKMLNFFARKTAGHTEKLKLFGLDLQNTATVALQTFLRLLLFSALLLASYLWLTFVFRQFPYTSPWGRALGTFLWQSVQILASGFVNAIPGLLTVIIIFLITRAVTKLIRDFFLGIESGRVSVPGMHSETAGATRRLINVALWMFAIVIAYPYLPGAESPAFKGVSVFVGLMLTLGSAGVINHLMSGLVLVYSRALSKNDYVSIGDVEGTVQEVGPLSVKIATPDRREVTIPNTVMTNTNIINYSRISKDKGLLLRATVTIGYDAPWRQVHELLKMAARNTEGTRKDTEPFVLQTALADFFVEYKVCVPLEKAEERIRRLSELHANIQDAFNEYGVQILSPHFESQPSSTIVVPKSKWFSAPANKPGAGNEREKNE
ncbi:MAG TPA: mechanosensitive ion channel family protein [Acidobacteriota bacterium]|nr:mechanosensitive ion channel family protein [Acidobacteriota bacterium]